MGDTRHSNVKPRPLGEVTVDSVYFDSPVGLYVAKRDAALCFKNGLRGLRNSLAATSTLSAAAGSADTSQPACRKSPHAHAQGVSGASVMTLISQLVTPISRTISIPQPRNNTSHGALLRINTAPSGFEKEKPMGDPCPSPVSSMDSGVADTSTSSVKSSKQAWNWREYRRQLSNVRRKEMCRRVNEVSKCDVVDMSAPDPSVNPVTILSQVRQREREYHELVSRADKMLQKKKTLPSVFITKQKRPGSLIKDMNVFSKTLKRRSRINAGDIHDVVVGRSIDQNSGDRQGESAEWNKYIDLTKRCNTEMGTNVSFAPEVEDSSARMSSVNIRFTIPSAIHSERSYSSDRRRQKVVTLQGKSLPKLYTGRPGRDTATPASYSARSETRHSQDVQLLRDINDKCDRIQKQISTSLSVSDNTWPQHGQFTTHRPGLATASHTHQRRQPVHVIYRSFQRMRYSKPEVRTRHNEAKAAGGNDVQTCEQHEACSNDVVNDNPVACEESELYFDDDFKVCRDKCEQNEEYVEDEVKVSHGTCEQNKQYLDDEVEVCHDACKQTEDFIADEGNACHSTCEQNDEYVDAKVKMRLDTTKQNEDYFEDYANACLSDNDEHNDEEDNENSEKYNEDEISEDENNNPMSIRTFHLTELDDTDFTDSDTEDEVDYRTLPDAEEMDVKPIAPLRLFDPTKQKTGAAKFQGPSSRISDDESGSQFHIVNGNAPICEKEAYKILKALDNDVYVDFEHRKYKRSGTLGSIGNSDNPRVHFLKVKVSENN